MVSAVSNIGAKSALFALRSNDRDDAGNRFGIVGGAARRGFGSSNQGIFGVSSAIKSESTIFRTLGESLGNARGVVNTARAGTNALGAIVDDAEKIIDAVEAGTSGSVFSGALGRLEDAAAGVVQNASVNGTNLLEEGSTLNVTIGFNANGGQFSFRELNFDAVGLAATDNARNTPQVVTETVTETVEVNITREERLNERVERLNDRVTRLDEREARIESRIERTTERQERLTDRVETLERRETRINDRLEAAGARPTDANDQRLLNLARRIDDFADTLEARGSTRLAEFVQGVADNTAERAGLTISLDRLDRLENKLEKTGERIEQTQNRITQLEERKTALGERLTQTAERRQSTVDRIDRIENRIANLTDAQRNQVVGTRTDTVEREVTRTIESPTAGSFDEIIGSIADRLRAGDTEGAREIVAEARERLGNVNEQLDTITGSLTRRGTFFGALTDRLDSAIRSKVEDLSDDAAARAAAVAIAESDKINRLFSGNGVKPGILELFQSEPAQQADADTDVDADSFAADEDEA